MFSLWLLVSVVNARRQGNMQPAINDAQHHRFLIAIVKALAVVAPEYTALEHCEGGSKTRKEGKLDAQMRIVASSLRQSFGESKAEDPWVMYLRYAPLDPQLGLPFCTELLCFSVVHFL